MKRTCCLVISFLMLCSTAITAQSIYHFQYKLPSADSRTYEAFFVRNSSSGGFVRILHNNAAGQPVITEMKLKEQFVSGTNSIIDPSVVYYKATKPELIDGDDEPAADSLSFWFALNAQSNEFEPSKITAFTADGKEVNAELMKAELQNSSGLRKEVVLRFFDENDQLYVTMFKAVTRGLNANEKNIKMHVILVCATTDPTLSQFSIYDLDRAENLYKKLADEIGIKANIIKIFGNSYNKKNVDAAVKNLKPAAADIVVFYYSGHGFRMPKLNRPYPFMDLRSDVKTQDYKQHTMNIEDIFLTLKSKPNRFTLVVSDCCNNDPEATNSIAPTPPEPRASDLKWNYENLRTLFLNPKKTSLLITAADKNQLATTNPKLGGFLSYYFKQSLENMLASSNPREVSWFKICEETRAKTIIQAKNTACAKPPIPANGCVQYPIYKFLF
ncbi:caspase family protein [Lacibacter sp.]|uniref:caspase family protein n=1 Tax=Lacibacter sp. TaxID=1915409 RepID=UPI002B4B82E5|nr:caspase family protein [Lacibacter sp.]HLP35511.1 caspase family protein [Lacibacter sp.]